MRNRFCIFFRSDVSEYDGFYNDLYVRQHDLLRELAIHQNSQDPMQERKRLNINVRGNVFPRWLTAKDEQTFSARLLSITTGLLTSTPSHHHRNV